MEGDGRDGEGRIKVETVMRRGMKKVGKEEAGLQGRKEWVLVVIGAPGNREAKSSHLVGK